MNQSEGFVSSRIAAQLLGISLTTVQLWVESGALRAWKTVGGHRRISRKSIDDMLEQQRATIEDDLAFVVVVVEDEAVQRQLYEMKFEEWDLPVTLITAANGFDGLLEIGRHKPGIVIADLDMPGLDGFELIRTIDQNNGPDSAQIIVMTGLSELEIAANGGLPEGIPVLSKPISFDALKTMLCERLASSAA